MSFLCDASAVGYGTRSCQQSLLHTAPAKFGAAS